MCLRFIECADDVSGFEYVRSPNAAFPDTNSRGHGPSLTDSPEYVGMPKRMSVTIAKDPLSITKN